MDWYDSDSDDERVLGRQQRQQGQQGQQRQQEQRNWGWGNSDSDESDEEPTLRREIERAGPRRYLTAQTRERFANIDRQNADAEIYGQQNTGLYSMENFITEVLELDMTSEDAIRAIQWDEATEYIIDKAVESININPNKKGIKFTPQDKTEYDKIKTIYDKLALDLNKMICERLKLSPCPNNSNSKLIQAVQEMYPDIRFEDGMTFGYKLKVIEDYLSTKTKDHARGRKTRRRTGTKKRGTKGRRTSTKTSDKSKRRRYARSKRR
jgi:hypothetical protein